MILLPHSCLHPMLGKIGPEVAAQRFASIDPGFARHTVSGLQSIIKLIIILFLILIFNTLLLLLLSILFPLLKNKLRRIGLQHLVPFLQLANTHLGARQDEGGAQGSTHHESSPGPRSF